MARNNAKHIRIQMTSDLTKSLNSFCCQWALEYLHEQQISHDLLRCFGYELCTLFMCWLCTELNVELLSLLNVFQSVTMILWLI